MTTVVNPQSETKYGTSGLEYMRDKSLTVSPASTSSALFIADHNEAIYDAAVDMPTPGHMIAVLGRGVMDSPGKEVGLVIAVEGTIEVLAGDIDQACASAYTLNDNASGCTINEFVGGQIQVSHNHGTINTFTGFKGYIPQNDGSIGDVNMFHVPDMGALSGVTGKRRALLNEDSASTIVSKGSICDASVDGHTPTNSSTVTLVKGKSTVALTPAGSIAGCTLAFPADAENGQEILIFSTQAIGALTFSGGTFGFIGAPASVAANGYFRLKKFSEFSSWVRVG